MSNLFAGTAAGLIAAYLAAILAGIAGWFTNVFYVFSNLSTMFNTPTLEHLLALAGTVLFPIGAIHGIYLWFV